MEVRNSPNVVPLCDILLVLLIIFMVITPMAQVGIDVTLPEKGGIEPPPRHPIVLSIQEDGSLLLNRSKFSNLGALEDELKGIGCTTYLGPIFVKAHHSITYQYLVSTIDLLKKTGLDKIAVVPTPYDGNPQATPIPVYRNN